MALFSIALDVIQEVRGSIAMFMFILEESMQGVGMAMWIAYKEKDYQQVLDLASYARNELLVPAKDFVTNYGFPAYPLDQAYNRFYDAFELSLSNFEKQANDKLGL